MKLKNLFYLLAIFAVFATATSHTALETIGSLFVLVSGFGINPGFTLGACAELTAFRTAVESLDQRVLRSPRLGRAMFWRNMIPRGTFVKNQGVTRSTFQVKTSEPTDSLANWNAITLTNGQLPVCDPTYEDIGVGFYERTYGPRVRKFRGPVICKEQLEFMHNPTGFLDAYTDSVGGYIGRTWEFTLRRDFLNFVPIFVDGVKYSGPNALATAPAAHQGLSQTNLNLMATGIINVGGGSMQDGYTTFGNNGPILPLEIDMVDSEGILRANSTIREDARFASEGMDGDGNYAVWKAIGANRVIGNLRHVATNTPLRLNWNGSAYTVVSPFKSVDAITSDDETLTTEYKNAGYGVAIALSPEVFTAEVVLPTNWKFPDSSNYNGELDFITGGERICNPAVYDPQHEKGRHFGVIKYAPAPNRPNVGAAIIYQRDTTPANGDVIFFS